MSALSLSQEQCQSLMEVLLRKHGDEVIATEMYRKFVRLLTTNNAASGFFDELSDAFPSWPEANVLAETGAAVARFVRNKGNDN